MKKKCYIYDNLNGEFIFRSIEELLKALAMDLPIVTERYKDDLSRFYITITMEDIEE